MSLAAAVFMWLAFCIAGYWYVVFYKVDKAIILKGPWPFAHSFFMETKEHLVITLLMLVTYLPVAAAGNLSANKDARRVVLCVAGLFIFQQFQLMSWQGQKSALDLQTKGVRSAQTQINRYNAWFDDSSRALNIMAALSRAFPLFGTQASAKSVRISNLSEVSVAGVASSSPQIVQIVEALATNSGVKPGSAAAPSQAGTPPNIQFTLNFIWEGNPNGE